VLSTKFVKPDIAPSEQKVLTFPQGCITITAQGNKFSTGGNFMNRTQFTFYESFYLALSLIKKKSDRCDAYEAIINYALYGDEPPHLPNDAAIAFEIARPVLESARKKAMSGQRGGLAERHPSLYD